MTAMTAELGMVLGLSIFVFLAVVGVAWGGLKGG